MTNSWRDVPLRELLTPTDVWTAIEPDRLYREITVKLWGRGIVLRREVLGAEVRVDKRRVVSTGDFVLSRIDARNGAMGVVPPELDGAIVSNDFPSFRADTYQLDVAFLGWLSKTEQFVELCRRASEGTTNRVRLQEDQFLSLTILLPALPDQRRIVARLQQVSSRLLEASELKAQAATALAQLPVLLAHRPDLTRSEKESQEWVERSVSQLVTESRSFHRVDRLATYPNLGIYSFGRGLFEKPPIDGARTSARELNQVRAGQFIYSRLFAFEGAYGVVPPELDGYFVSNEYPTFDCNPDLALPEFLRAYFASPNTWHAVSEGSQGLGDRRQRVQPSTLLAHRLLVPPLCEQRRVRDLAPRVQSVLDLGIACRSQNEMVSAALINQFLTEGRGGLGWFAP